MEIRITRLIEKEEIANAIKFATMNFVSTEQKFYTKFELRLAQESYKNLDVMNVDVIIKLLKEGKVRAFVATIKSQVIGVCAVEIKSGKILFFAVLDEKHFRMVAAKLTETMIEARSSEPTNVLYVMALVGQQAQLKQIGYINVCESVLYYQDLKLVPMKYTYAQLDIEK